MHRQSRFTLIELVIVLVIVGVLGAVASGVIGDTIQHRRFRATLHEMELLKIAIVGGPGLKGAGVRTDFGFAGNVGRLPTSLRELVENYNVPALPPWSVTTGIGWRPRIERGFAEDTDAFRQDGWGNFYIFFPATGVIMSYGSDGAPGGVGYATDFSTRALTFVGTLSGVVTDVLGNPIADTAATDVRVEILVPSHGSQVSLADETDASGVSHFTNIPAGNRRLRAIVGGTLHRLERVAVIYGATHNLRVAADVTAPEVPTAFTAESIPLSHINLAWSPPTLNTDGTHLIDLAGLISTVQQLPLLLPIPLPMPIALPLLDWCASLEIE